MTIDNDRFGDKKKKAEKDPLDRNKTALTHRLTALASGYLDVLGCKPIETEVPVCSFIVDVAGFTYPTMTEMKKSKLLDSAIADNPLLKGKDRYLITEYITRKTLFPLTAVIEVKVTIADLKKDLDRKFNGNIADLNYIIIPKNIEAKAKKLIDFTFLYRNSCDWSLLIASDDGERIIKAEIPHIRPVPIDRTLEIVANIAIRRCHRTRYAYIRNALKQYRVNARNDKNSGEFDNPLVKEGK